MWRTIGLGVFAFFALVLLDATGFVTLRPRERRGVPAVLAQMDNLGVALDTFRQEVGRYPTSDEGLQALRHRPAGLTAWQGPYVKKDVPPDPWGRPFIYRSTGDDYELSSLGADGNPGGSGGDADAFRLPQPARRPPS
jgi:type II secretion system protein G